MDVSHWTLDSAIPSVVNTWVTRSLFRLRKSAILTVARSRRSSRSRVLLVNASFALTGPVVGPRRRVALSSRYTPQRSSPMLCSRNGHACPETECQRGHSSPRSPSSLLESDAAAWLLPFHSHILCHTHIGRSLEASDVPCHPPFPSLFPLCRPPSATQKHERGGGGSTKIVYTRVGAGKRCLAGIGRGGGERVPLFDARAPPPSPRV